MRCGFGRSGDRPGIATALGLRANLELVAGELDAAEADYRMVSGNSARYAPWVAYCLAEVAEARGDLATARSLLISARRDLERCYGLRAGAACDARLAALDSA